MQAWQQNNEKQWTQLKSVLQHRQTPTVIWISCNDYFYRKELQERFIREFPDHQHVFASLKNFKENNLESFFKHHLPPDAFEKSDKRYILHLSEIESQISPHLQNEKDKPRFFEVLNFEREIIFGALPFSVVFWSAIYTEMEVQQLAPDFWDWLVYKFHFQSPPVEPRHPAQQNEGIISPSQLKKPIENENVIYNRIARYLQTLKSLDDKPIDRLSILKRIASDYYDIGEYLKAEEVIKEALSIPNIPEEEAGELLNLAGRILSSLNQFEQAGKKYKEALKIYRELAGENPKTFLPGLASTLNNLANLQSDRNEFAQALENYQEALRIKKALAKENPKAFLPDVVTILNNLAILYSAKNEFTQALENFKEALKIYRALAKENPNIYLDDLAMTLNNLATLQSDKNKFAQALGNYKEALKIYRALAKENPKTYLSDVATTLNNLANLHSAKNEFTQALEKYEEALKIYRALTKENPKTSLTDVAATLNNLANLHSAKNEFTQALEKYEEALKIYRALAKENPKTYLPFLATTLNNLAVLYHKNNELEQAMDKYREALNIRRALAKENPNTYLPSLAETLINMSIFHLESVPDKEKSVASAKEALQIVLPLYQKIPYLENYLKTALEILQEHDMDVEKLMEELGG